MTVKSFLELAKNQKEPFCIFGAGQTGQIVYNLCKENKIPVQCFCVSDTKKNKSSFNELPVVDVKETALNVNTPIVVAVLERGEKRIKDYLVGLGFKNVIPLPEDILHYDSQSEQRYRSPIIEVTSRIGCSVNCRYCPQNVLLTEYFKYDKKRPAILSLEDYKRYLDSLPPETIVDFAGFAEPFLNKDALPMMEYTVESGHDCYLFTTFNGLSLKDFDRLVKIPFSLVTLHVADKDRYANISVNDDYLKLLSVALRAKKPNGSNFIDKANCQSEPHPSVLELTEGKLRIYCELYDWAGNIDSDAKNLAHANKKGRIRCSRAVAMNHFILLPDGSLALCCSDWGLKHIVGNLNESSYEEIMHGERMKQIWKLMESSAEEELLCRKCYYAEDVK